MGTHINKGVTSSRKSTFKRSCDFVINIQETEGKNKAIMFSDNKASNEFKATGQRCIIHC